ncbi:MAG: hypothetical protein K9W42_12965 [Candidatus Heimdallarchaeota archaeon]|nr:hypothetical protein [Candidatus Heimdallarchaeota archaeon]
MVEPPYLQVEFDTRQKFIPKLVEKYCKEKYRLEIIPPKIGADPKPGPIPRPTFRILDVTTGELVAFFNPHGRAECYHDDFEPLFEQILTDLKKAVEEAALEFKQY